MGFAEKLSKQRLKSQRAKFRGWWKFRLVPEPAPIPSTDASSSEAQPREPDVALQLRQAPDELLVASPAAPTSTSTAPIPSIASSPAASTITSTAPNPSITPSPTSSLSPANETPQYGLFDPEPTAAEKAKLPSFIQWETPAFLKLGPSILKRVAIFLDYPSVVCLNATCKGLQQIIDISPRIPTAEEKKIIRDWFIPTLPLADDLNFRCLPLEETTPVKRTAPFVEQIPPVKVTPPNFEITPTTQELPTQGCTSSTRAIIKCVHCGKRVRLKNVPQCPQDCNGGEACLGKAKQRDACQSCLVYIGLTRRANGPSVSATASGKPRPQCVICLGILNGTGKPEEWCLCR